MPSRFVAVAVLAGAIGLGHGPQAAAADFSVVEATIADIHAAIRRGDVTAVDLVEQYLARISAFNGTCVREPDGPLGRVEPIANAGRINALSTLNLRPAAREARGFDARKARSMTDADDDDPGLPDALETAAELDRQYAATGELTGPLHGIVLAIKDQYDTADMRTTAGADAFYANDRPPDDATFVARLRAAGAIILAKANLGEYASPMARSAFGGTFCNPYDTTRYPGGSSGGSGSSVAANLVTCAIAEETGASIRTPSRHNSAVGIAPTQELVSRDGMIGAGINTRTGPICRSVADAARILEVIAGYDPRDEFTAYAIDRLPDDGYATYAEPGPLDGVRIGVVREYMDARLFTRADHAAIALVESALDDLAALGATLVDPGTGGALMQDCLDRYNPYLNASAYIAAFPERFPVDEAGRPAADHIATLLDMTAAPATVPPLLSLRDFGPSTNRGDGRYLLERYLRERGDTRIRTVADLAAHARFFDQPDFAGSADRRGNLERLAGDMTLDTATRVHKRFAIRQIVLQCMAVVGVDVLTYPTGNVPAPVLGQPYEPNVNGRNGGSSWNLLGQQGFPAITVPAGFTSIVFDRVRDTAAADGTRLVGPVPARLPIGIDFLGRPFAEPLLIRVAAAYEAATRHREPPPDFGPLEAGR